MPVITEEGFDTLQESTIQEDPSVDPKPESGDESKDDSGISAEEKKKSESEAATVSSERTLPLVPGKGADDDIDDDDDDDDEDIDETLSERLWGLTEMFPESFRGATSAAADLSLSLVKSTYAFSCNAAWIVASSATILVLPVMFELERAQMEQQQLQQQRQILLGPNAAASGSMPGMTPR